MYSSVKHDCRRAGGVVQHREGARPPGLLMVLVFVAGLVTPSIGQDSPSLEEIRAGVAAGDYRGALDKAKAQLISPSLDEPTRYQLLMLKGECQLQLRDRTGACSAFKSAAKVASNAKELAAAKANALIVDRSMGGRYTPRGRIGAEAIDILPMDSRKQAMLALQEELWSQHKLRIDAALKSDKLPPIEQVFPHLADMYFLETFAKGEATQTGKVMQDLGDHTFHLLQTEVAKCSSRIDYLTQLANSAIDAGGGWNVARLGLTSPQRDEVRTMAAYLTQLRDRATEYRGIAARLGGNQGRWDALVADSVTALSDAESLYNDR